MQVFRLLIYAAAVVLLVNACTKDPLPEPSMEGLNTFGCKINGKVWKPYGLQGEVPAVWPITIEFSQVAKDTFSVFIYTSKAGTNEHVQLTIPNAVKGYNALSSSPGKAFAVFYDNDFRHFFTYNLNSGGVTITHIDPVNAIISGTFEFEAQEIVNKQKVMVTEGRFDIDIKESTPLHLR